MPLTILKVAILAPLHQLFDYLLPDNYSKEELIQGVRVQVPFGRRQVIGIVMHIAYESDIPKERLKPITAILDTAPLLPPTLMKLIHWASQYYHHPLGEVIDTALPVRLRKFQAGRRRKTSVAKKPFFDLSLADADACKPVLNTHQQKAFNAIVKSFAQFNVFLLEGITGSGKTEVYLQLIQKALETKKQILVLVPEISLTPQLMARLQKRLGDCIACSHSGLTDLQRLDSWQMIKEGTKQVLLGTRSTVFTPFKQLGLIIIDEEQDHSFKQQGGLAYHARDIAVMRAHLEDIPIVLGSATPSLESVWNAKQKRYHALTLPKRASNVALPQVAVIDLRNQNLKAGLSKQLLTLIKEHLESKGQVLLFLNRRGFAPIYLCHGCGWVIMCSECDSPLRLHHRPNKLQCHLCEASAAVFTQCPHCHQEQLFALGQGTQRLEEALEHYFPDTKLIRVDADSTRNKGSLLELLTSINVNEPAILVGTQLLAKGHHFPGVTLAALIDGDAGLFSTDFRSGETAAQMITQVAGRSGRGEKVGEVVIQTYHPEHPLLRQLLEKGYVGFTELALKERKQALWPPFSYLAMLRVEARHQATNLAFLNAIKTQCSIHHHVMLLGPTPALLTKKAGYYRAQLLFKAKERADLHRVLNHLIYQLELMPKRGIRYTLEVDPLDIG